MVGVRLVSHGPVICSHSLKPLNVADLTFRVLLALHLFQTVSATAPYCNPIHVALCCNSFLWLSGEIRRFLALPAL